MFTMQVQAIDIEMLSRRNRIPKSCTRLYLHIKAKAFMNKTNCASPKNVYGHLVSLVLFVVRMPLLVALPKVQSIYHISHIRGLGALEKSSTVLGMG